MRAFRLLIVALAAANLAAAQSNPTRSFQVVWQAGGGADPDSSFADLSALTVSPNGDVVAWDRRTPALRLYNDAGKFLRIIGRKGAGPGEYGTVSGIAYGPDGRFYVWDSGNCRLNAYKANGDFEKQFRLPICSYATNDGLTIDTQGRAWLRFTLFDRAAGKTEGAWVRLRAADGTVIDTVKQPQLAGSDPQLVARSEGGMSTSSIPYGRYPSFALTAAGDVMTTPGDKYEIDVPQAGKVVKISRAFTPVRISADERAQYKAFFEWSMRRTQPDWTWPSTPMPSVKPPIQSIAGALDGRVWVALNVESERFTPEPSTARGGAAAPPQITFRHVGMKWDVFEADGRFIGTVASPIKIRPRVMRGDFAWGIALDDDDVPTLVKLKVVPPLSAR